MTSNHLSFPEFVKRHYAEAVTEAPMTGLKHISELLPRIEAVKDSADKPAVQMDYIPWPPRPWRKGIVNFTNEELCRQLGLPDGTEIVHAWTKGGLVHVRVGTHRDLPVVHEGCVIPQVYVQDQRFWWGPPTGRTIPARGSSQFSFLAVVCLLAAAAIFILAWTADK